MSSPKGGCVLRQRNKTLRVPDAIAIGRFVDSKAFVFPASSTCYYMAKSRYDQ